MIIKEEFKRFTNTLFFANNLDILDGLGVSAECKYKDRSSYTVVSMRVTKAQIKELINHLQDLVKD